MTLIAGVLSLLAAGSPAAARMDTSAFLDSAKNAPAVELRENARGDFAEGMPNPIDDVQVTLGTDLSSSKTKDSKNKRTTPV